MQMHMQISTEANSSPRRMTWLSPAPNNQRHALGFAGHAGGFEIEHDAPSKLGQGKADNAKNPFGSETPLAHP
jgi:hypothetical protein